MERLCVPGASIRERQRVSSARKRMLQFSDGEASRHKLVQGRGAAVRTSFVTTGWSLSPPARNVRRWQPIASWCAAMESRRMRCTASTSSGSSMMSGLYSTCGSDARGEMKGVGWGRAVDMFVGVLIVREQALLSTSSPQQPGSPWRPGNAHGEMKPPPGFPPPPVLPASSTLHRTHRGKSAQSAAST